MIFSQSLPAILLPSQANVSQNGLCSCLPRGGNCSFCGYWFQHFCLHSFPVQRSYSPLQKGFLNLLTLWIVLQHLSQHPAIVCFLPWLPKCAVKLLEAKTSTWIANEWTNRVFYLPMNSKMNTAVNHFTNDSVRSLHSGQHQFWSNK